MLQVSLKRKPDWLLKRHKDAIPLRSSTVPAPCTPAKARCPRPAAKPRPQHRFNSHTAPDSRGGFLLAGGWHGLNAGRDLLPLFGRDEFMIPFHVSRPAMASRAHRIFPILATLWAHATGIESIPEMFAAGIAHPPVQRTRLPLAFRTKYFDLPHGFRNRVGKAKNGAKPEPKPDNDKG